MRLWELPTFAERGELSAVHDARALTAGSALGLLVSGDKHGAVKVCNRRKLSTACATAQHICRPSQPTDHCLHTFQIHALHGCTELLATENAVAAPVGFATQQCIRSAAAHRKTSLSMTVLC